MMGTCALCQLPAELQNSHFLPAGLYKAIMQGHAPYADAPVMMDITKGTAVQTSAQVRKPLLCAPCEQRFSRNGEDHVIANCHRKDGEFNLRETLKNLKPSSHSNGRAIYLGRELPLDFHASAYHYFFISILWRASVTDWPGATGVEKGCLGARYEESFRRYLLGERAFPENTSVNIYVNYDTEPTTFLTFPTHKKVLLNGSKVDQHILHIPGARFIAFVGGKVPSIEIEGVTWTPGLPTFFEWRLKQTELHRRLVRDVAGTVAKGKLAKGD